MNGLNKMPRSRENIVRVKAPIWLPREADVSSDITVDGTSVLLNYTHAEFTRALAPEIGDFKINLINADGKYSNVYSGGEIVKLFVDLVDGTTLRFKGTIDNIKNKRKGFEILEISGGHVSAELLDLTVTKEYSGNKTCDAILIEIIGDKLTGYTTTNISSSTVSPTLKWSNVPFWTAVDQLCQLAVVESDKTSDLNRFDCYVDDDKGFHFFPENSIENNNEAIVWNDTLINLDGFGDRIYVTKNKAIVYGDDGTGLPIIRTDNAFSAQTSFNLKEDVIRNTDIVSGTQAEEIASAIVSNQSQPKKEGSALTFILPSIKVGDKIWITDPTMKINQQIKISKFTHMYPKEQTKLVMTREQTLPKAIRELSLGDLANAEIINPFEMTKSINFTYDDFSGIASFDTNIKTIDGKIKLSSGSTGTFVSEVFTQEDSISQVHLKLVGEKLTTIVVKVRANGTDTFQQISQNVLSNITSGKDIEIQVQINDADTEIDSLALLI